MDQQTNSPDAMPQTGSENAPAPMNDSSTGQTMQQGNSSKTMLYLLIAVVVFIAIAGLALLLASAASNNSANPDSTSDTGDEKMMEDDKMEKDDEKMDGDDKMEDDTMEKDSDSTDDDKMMDDGEQMQGQYVDYDASLLANAEDGDVVLFFHADWCPTCRTLDASLNESLADIPADLTILKTDYDSETQLKQKYGVTYQHTLVQVDSEGNELKQWSGSYSVADIVAELT